MVTVVLTTNLWKRFPKNIVSRIYSVCSHRCSHLDVLGNIEKSSNYLKEYWICLHCYTVVVVVVVVVRSFFYFGVEMISWIRGYGEC